MTGRRRAARARIARFECGVGAAACDGATVRLLRRGVVGVEAARRRFLEGVRGVESESSGSVVEATSEDSPSDLTRYSPSLSAPVSGSSSATFRRRFVMGWTATIHGAPEPHSMPSALARSRDCSRWLRQSSS